jgi:hypothetical protein
MAYAKLVFPAGTFALKKLKEIARFATGAVTSTSGLEFADTSLSEIVISDPAGWTLQAQSFEASGTATSTQYRLTAPCVDSSKNKCVLMGTYSARSLGGSIGPVTTVSYAAPTSSATTAYLWFQAGSSWTSTTLNTPTTIWLSIRNPSGSSATMVRNDPGVGLNSDTIYVFSSARKLIVYGIESAGIASMASILEFKETSHTTKNSNIPVLCSNSNRFDADSPTVTTGALIPPSSTTYNIYYSHQLVNWYVPALGTRTTRNLSDWGVNNTEFFTSPANLNITAAGASAYPLIPLTDIRNVYGEGIHNYSDLTDMYLTYRDAAYTGQGDTLNVGGTTYTVLQCGPATANYRAFAIKKA